VLRNSGYLLSANTLQAGLGFIQSVLAARLLGVEALGLLGAITQFASVINRFTSFRMGELVISYVGQFGARRQDQHAAAVFKASALAEMTSSLLAYGILLGLAPLGARFFAKDPSLVGLFRLYGLSVLANLIAESSAGLLQILNRFRALAAFTVGQSVLTLLLIVAAYVRSGGLAEVLMAYLIGKVAYAVGISAVAMVEAGRHWGRQWWKAPLQLLQDRRAELVRFSLSTNVTTTLTLVTRDSEMLWLSALSSPLQAGYYKIALAIMNIVIMPIDPLIRTTYREIAREIGGRHWDNVRYLLRSGSVLSALWTIPVVGGLILFGPWLIVTFWGEVYLPSYPSVVVLLVGVLAVNIFYWNRNVLLPLGKPGFPTGVYLVGAILRVAGMLVLVPALGALGMALLLSAFYLGTVSVLVTKTVREIQLAAAS
jgi:O-antigen/teichoic acid export membrane protein